MSVKSSAKKDKASSRPGLLQRCLLLLLSGLFISGYLLYHHFELRSGSHRGPSICNLGGSFDCDAVSLSKFSELFGVPLGGYGLLYYLTFTLIGLFYVPSKDADSASKTGFVNSMFFLAVCSFIPTLFLAYISVFYLGKVCLFCFLLYLINFLLLFLTYFGARESGSFLKRLLAGAVETLGYFSPLKNLSTALIIWFVLVSTGGIVFNAQALLARTILNQEGVNAQFELTLEQWHKAPQMSLPLKLDTDAMSKDFSLGSRQPKLTIVEFSDFECPNCRRISPYIKEAVFQNVGVRFVFKNYPLDANCRDGASPGLHKFACQAAVLARCAGYQSDDAFWRMHDGLFSLEGYQWSLEKLLSLPTELGLDDDAIMRCMSQTEAKARVKEDIAQGDVLGISGTPSLFINGKKVRLMRFEHLPKLVKRILAE